MIVNIYEEENFEIMSNMPKKSFGNLRPLEVAKI